MSTKTVKLAAAQLLTRSDIAANGRKICAAVREAHEAGCKAVLFHEGCLTGYPCSRQRLARIDFAEVRRIERQVARLAKRLAIAVLLGSTSVEDKAYYNDLLIVDEGGTVLGRYTKTWRAGEPFYTAGPGPAVFRVAGLDATAIICHDLRYPELPRLAVAAGAQIVFIANNESGITAEYKLLGYRAMQIARATENHVYAVMANCPADPEHVTLPNQSHGNSKIVDPMGNVLDEAGSFEERLVTATLDLQTATRDTALRTVGKAKRSRDLYGAEPEHPAYAAWMKSGLNLVRRLDGTTKR